MLNFRAKGEQCFVITIFNGNQCQQVSDDRIKYVNINYLSPSISYLPG